MQCEIAVVYHLHRTRIVRIGRHKKVRAFFHEQVYFVVSKFVAHVAKDVAQNVFADEAALLLIKHFETRN